MALTPGTRLGSYEVTAQIGVGGMGEVYRATDTNLKRQVAIKVLPESVAGDTERIARFQREAEVLAALNHPNIAQIYGLERSAGATGLVMELVEGPTLADRISAAGLPSDESLAIAKQIAEALEAAHEQGIIHRDLKPANIKVRPDGTVKVLDFGLAKALDPAGPAGQGPAYVRAGASQSPTITTPAMTQMGMVLGTAAYMSPEQARGKPVDKRADIWAFGCVLFEMLTGAMPFPGDDVSQTLARVIDREPDWSALPKGVSPVLVTFLRRCLDKDPRRRLGDIRDMRLALDGAFDTGVTPVARDAVVHGARGLRLMVPVGAALVAGAVISGAAVWSVMRPAPVPVSRLALDDASTASLAADVTFDRPFTVTPDGQSVVFSAAGGSELLVRELRQIEAKRVTQASGARGVFMAPTGEWVGFAEGGTLKKVALTGGPSLTICSLDNAAPRGATWGGDDTIVFGTDSRETGLQRVAAAGGDPVTLTKPDAERGEGDHVWPEFLPGRRAVLFTITPASGSIEDAQIAVLDLDSGARKVLVRGGSHAQYSSSGHLVYGSSGTLRAVPFDLDSLEVTGTPVPVVSDVTTTAIGAAQFVVTGNGTLVYVVGGGRGRQLTMTWVGRDGREEPLMAPARFYRYPRVSPDGMRVAVDIRDEDGLEDVWIWQRALGTLTRLTFDPGRDTHPAWTPDGRRVVFSSNRSGSRNLYWQSADGTGEAERVSETTAQQMAMDVSSDGLRLVVREGTTPYDLTTLLLGKGLKTEPLIRSSFSETSADISPDGRWLAYDSDESGQREVFVRPFPDVSQGRWQVSAGGGSRPVWSHDGRELFFASTTEPDAAVPSGKLAMMRVRVAGGPAWVVDRPTRLFEGTYYFSNIAGVIGEGQNFDISPDGRRFLMLKEAASTAATRPEIFVVQNWQEELKRLVPVN